MINIAICDDDKCFIKEVMDITRKTAGKEKIEIKVQEYFNGKILYDDFVSMRGMDILILDIDMPHINGLELAKKIRKQDENVIIMFLSAHDEYVFQSLEYTPYRYIRKLFVQEELPAALSSALLKAGKSVEKKVSFKTEEGNVWVNQWEIVYYETEKRKTAIHLKDGTKILVGKTMSELGEILDSNTFISIHRSCVVNTSFVKKIGNDIIELDNGEKLIVSRARFKEFRQTLLKVWGEQI